MVKGNGAAAVVGDLKINVESIPISIHIPNNINIGLISFNVNTVNVTDITAVFSQCAYDNTMAAKR